MAANRVIFFIHKDVHILDLAGALQVFYEASYYGHPYDIVYVSDSPGLTCSSRLQLTGLKKFSTVKVLASDTVVIPGYDLRQLSTPESKAFHGWLCKADAVKATICSICTGAFTLARAGLLDHKECTTHWKYTERLQRDYPGVQVLSNRLFVKSGHIYTSAGIITGLDMALFLMEERHGPEFAYQLARELMVYIRRDGDESQESIYLQYRKHIRDDIHAVQDWIIRNLHKKIRVEALAALIHTSPRNLTRLFKTTTGITIGQYLEKLRVEKAIRLLHGQTKIGMITRQCGLQSDNQLRQMIKKHTGRLPSAMREASSRDGSMQDASRTGRKSA